MAIIINYGFEKDFIRGDTKVLSKFRPVEAGGEPMALKQDDQLYFTMKDRNKVTKVKKKIGNGITLESDGYYHITLETTDTEDLNADIYKYDIELDLAENPLFVQTLIEGEIKLKEDVTTKEDKTNG